MKRWWLVVVIVVAVQLGGATTFYFLTTPTIPAAYRQQFSHALLVPANRSVVLDRGSISYTASSNLLIFHVHSTAGDITFNEQPVPANFSNDPSALTNLTKGMGEYQTLETEVGTVHLTRPKDIDAKQVAVIATAGTLIFIYPANDLGELQWRQLFAALAVRT